MIVTALFDVFFAVVGVWAIVRLIKIARIGAATYQGTNFARTEHPVAFWSVTALNVALVIGAVYGIAVGAGL